MRLLFTTTLRKHTIGCGNAKVGKMRGIARNSCVQARMLGNRERHDLDNSNRQTTRDDEDKMEGNLFVAR